MQHHHHDHHHDDGHEDGGFLKDMVLLRAMQDRRRALKWFAGVGTAAVVTGCGGGSASDSVAVVSGTTTSTATATPTPTATSTAAATSSTTTTTTSGGSTTACVADASETNGPYPADGTNTSSGSSSNALTVSGVVRSDIRSSFISSTTVATGVQLTLTLTVVNVNAACAPLSGYAVYIWMCDRRGLYSLYTVANESYLRGVQVTDANGQVTFTAIIPGCYDGRWPHIHFEVFSSLATATSGRYASLVSQLALPLAVCQAVYADTTTYPSSTSNLSRVSLTSDNVFGDNTAAQRAQQTPTLTGSPSTGYTGTAIIGLAR